MTFTPLTFYCRTCGQCLVAAPGHTVACLRCGKCMAAPQPIVPQLAAPPAQAVFAPGPVHQPTPWGTPGVVVALLLYFFFPAGLYLLWTHPVWTEVQKWKYTFVWLGCVGALFFIALMVGLMAAVLAGNIAPVTR